MVRNRSEDTSRDGVKCIRMLILEIDYLDFTDIDVTMWNHVHLQSNGQDISNMILSVSKISTLLKQVIDTDKLGFWNSHTKWSSVEVSNIRILSSESHNGGDSLK